MGTAYSVFYLVFSFPGLGQALFLNVEASSSIYYYSQNKPTSLGKVSWDMHCNMYDF